MSAIKFGVVLQRWLSVLLDSRTDISRDLFSCIIPERDNANR
jgi:hypothetical protein